MAAKEIHVGDIGTVFRVTLKDDKKIVDISTATELSILFKKPDGVTIEKPAVLTDDGTDGKLEYIAESGFIDQEGEEWFMQAYVKMAGGEWKSEIHKFRVYENLM